MSIKIICDVTKSMEQSPLKAYSHTVFEKYPAFLEIKFCYPVHKNNRRALFSYVVNSGIDRASAEPAASLSVRNPPQA
jgi:hypothetical protein